MKKTKVKPEDLVPLKQNQNEESVPKPKNPRWIKITFHVIIVSFLVRIGMDQNAIFDILPLAIWIWLGRDVQRNKIIVPERFNVFLVLFLIIELFASYPSAIKLFQWLSSVWS